jgi:membrane protein CcdC involved in cytochrome C biogenesis
MPLLHVHPLVLVAASILGAGAMIAWRFRETSRPITLRKIVAPPLGMSTGLAMFLAPAARVPWAWAAAAFLLGAVVLAIPVARASRLVRRGDAVFLERSRAFLWILLGVVAVRLVLRTRVEQVVSPIQTGGLFFLLAFGMIVRWRVAMLLAYRRLTRPVTARFTDPQ